MKSIEFNSYQYSGVKTSKSFGTNEPIAEFLDLNALRYRVTQALISA